MIRKSQPSFKIYVTYLGINSFFSPSCAVNPHILVILMMSSACIYSVQRSKGKEETDVSNLLTDAFMSANVQIRLE